MKTQSLQFKVNNYKSIHEATIQIQGMTVLTGPSGSGKTTLLNFVNQMLTCIIRYENQAQEETFENMHKIEQDLYSIVSSYQNERIKQLMKDPYRKKNYPKKYWEKLLDQLQKIYDEEYPPVDESLTGKRIPSRKIYSNIAYRGKDSLVNLRKIVYPDIDYKKPELPDLIKFIREHYEKVMTIQNNRLRNRPSDYLPFVYEKLYRQEMEDIDYQISQDNFTIASNTLSLVGKIDTIDKVYYMKRTEESFIYNFFRSDSYFMDSSWFEKKRKETTGVYPNGEDKEIREFLYSMLRGKLSLEEFYSIKKPNNKPRLFWAYKREDGVAIRVRGCEPGLKTFFVLQRMLDEGLLTKDKLILFDQPESFLGSDRIVQFARLVCLIQKQLGVKFLFATNLREMIDALEKAAIEFDLVNTLHIYESKEIKSSFQYDYHLKE